MDTKVKIDSVITFKADTAIAVLNLLPLQYNGMPTRFHLEQIDKLNYLYNIFGK